jgi:hypothetical protein
LWPFLQFALDISDFIYYIYKWFTIICMPAITVVIENNNSKGEKIMPKLSNLFGGSEPMPNFERPVIVDPIVPPTFDPIGQPTPEPVIGDPASVEPGDSIDPTVEPGTEPISGHGGSDKPRPSSEDVPTEGPVEEEISGDEPESEPEHDEEPAAEAPVTDPNCPPGYKPVIIYVPEDMPTSELPALPVGPDGHVVPPTQDGPEKPDQGPLKPEKPWYDPWFEPGKIPNPNMLPWINPDIYNPEANPHIGIVPSDQEIPGSIGHVELPDGALQVPEESQGWWHSVVERFQNIPLVEKIQDYVNEKRASLAADGVDISDPSLQQDGMGITD